MPISLFHSPWPPVEQACMMGKSQSTDIANATEMTSSITATPEGWGHGCSFSDHCPCPVLSRNWLGRD